MSDELCRLATGGVFSGRELYKNFDEVGFEACLPIVLNGIPDLATQPDLADRSIIMRLPAISNEERKTETELWDQFNEAHPRIFGSLLDALSGALKRIDSLEVSSYPRMADWMRFVTAAEPALGFDLGTFAECFEDSRKAADAVILGDEPVANLLETFMKTDAVRVNGYTWTGTMSELLIALSNSMTKETVSIYGVPARAQPDGRAAGIVSR